MPQRMAARLHTTTFWFCRSPSASLYYVSCAAATAKGGIALPVAVNAMVRARHLLAACSPPFPGSPCRLPGAAYTTPSRGSARARALLLPRACLPRRCRAPRAATLFTAVVSTPTPACRLFTIPTAPCLSPFLTCLHTIPPFHTPFPTTTYLPACVLGSRSTHARAVHAFACVLHAVPAYTARCRCCTTAAAAHARARTPLRTLRCRLRAAPLRAHTLSLRFVRSCAFAFVTAFYLLFFSSPHFAARFMRIRTRA